MSSLLLVCGDFRVRQSEHGQAVFVHCLQGCVGVQDLSLGLNSLGLGFCCWIQGASET